MRAKFEVPFFYLDGNDDLRCVFAKDIDFPFLPPKNMLFFITLKNDYFWEVTVNDFHWSTLDEQLVIRFNEPEDCEGNKDNTIAAIANFSDDPTWTKIDG